MNKFFVALLAVVSFSSFSQTYEDYEAKYKSAKVLLDAGNYEQAVLAFNEVSGKVDFNPFMPYARFYKAVCYKELGKLGEARFVLNGLFQDAKKWEKLDEVNYLLSQLNLELKEYERAETARSNIKDDSLRLKAKYMLYHYAVKENDLTELKKLQAVNKKDEVIAKICAVKIEGDTAVDARFFLNYLIQDYELEGFEEIKKGEKKDVYKVAVFIPFSADDKQAYKRTKFLDLFHGILMAVDTLKSKGVDLELEVYDTKKSTSHVKSLLDNPSFKEFDLILGPLYSGTSKVVADFAEKNSIVMFNLLNRHDDISEDKPFVYSSLATYKVLGTRLAEKALVAFDTTKEVRIYYHHDNKYTTDSIVARSYKNKLEENGVKVALFKAISSGADEMDSYRRSLEWSKESSTGHVAIFARKNNLMASTLISVWETEDKKIPVLVPSEWMELSLINYEQYFRRNIHFYAPEYVDAGDRDVMKFQGAYRKKMKIKPLELGSASLGYELTVLCGLMLQKHGTFFHQNFTAGYQTFLLKGLNFEEGYSNSVVPILKFDEELNLIMANSNITND